LSVDQVLKRLQYVDKALRLLRKELGDQRALIGFSGSPWTLANFMLNGGSAATPHPTERADAPTLPSPSRGEGKNCKAPTTRTTRYHDP